MRLLQSCYSHPAVVNVAKALDFSIQFILEVIGAGGAIWGGSDAAGFRTKNNEMYWRVAVAVVSVLACIRFSFYRYRDQTKPLGFFPLEGHAPLLPTSVNSQGLT